LRGAGARGRGATLFGSLGLHFNIDAPAADLPRITAVMLALADGGAAAAGGRAGANDAWSGICRRPIRRPSCTGSRRRAIGPTGPG
ncbi:hypothetical protein, partial [Inquilinus limosus]|uniref:hypothetical protein n=1 Tax=Inquilinus limosus TaxID=171674 RepID=UPI001930DEF3